MKKISKIWDILTDEEKSFAPHWAMVLFVFPVVLVLLCCVGEWLNSL